MHISTHFVAVLPDAVVCLDTFKMSVCLPAALYIYIYVCFLITDAQTQWGVNLGLIDCCTSNTLTETVKNKCNLFSICTFTKVLPLFQNHQAYL